MASPQRVSGPAVTAPQCGPDTEAGHRGAVGTPVVAPCSPAHSTSPRFNLGFRLKTLRLTGAGGSPALSSGSSRDPRKGARLTHARPVRQPQPPLGNSTLSTISQCTFNSEAPTHGVPGPQARSPREAERRPPAPAGNRAGPRSAAPGTSVAAPQREHGCGSQAL